MRFNKYFRLAVLFVTLLFLLPTLVSAQSVVTGGLTGIVTDTGSFRFRNTTPEALSLSAYLLEHGGDLTLLGVHPAPLLVLDDHVT